MDLEEGEILISDVSSDSSEHTARTSKKLRVYEYKSVTISHQKISHKAKRKPSLVNRNDHYCNSDSFCRHTFKGHSCLLGNTRNGEERRRKGRPMVDLIPEEDRGRNKSKYETTPYSSNSDFDCSYMGSKQNKLKRKKKNHRTKSVSSHNSRNSVRQEMSELDVQRKAMRQDEVLLRKVISKSGPHSVQSALGSQRENHSLMNKLITAGLAKKPSSVGSDLDVEVGSSVSVSSPELDICGDVDEIEIDDSTVAVVHKETFHTRNQIINEDYDSEIEVIIPPKKIPLLVTLDSDGEEVDRITKEFTSNQNSSKILNLSETLNNTSENEKRIIALTSLNVSSSNDKKPDKSTKCTPTESSDINIVDSEEEPPPYSPSSPSSGSSFGGNFNKNLEPLSWNQTDDVGSIQMDKNSFLENTQPLISVEACSTSTCLDVTSDSDEHSSQSTIQEITVSHVSSFVNTQLKQCNNENKTIQFQIMGKLSEKKQSSGLNFSSDFDVTSVSSSTEKLSSSVPERISSSPIYNCRTSEESNRNPKLDESNNIDTNISSTMYSTQINNQLSTSDDEVYSPSSCYDTRINNNQCQVVNITDSQSEIENNADNFSANKPICSTETLEVLNISSSNKTRIKTTNSKTNSNEINDQSSNITSVNTDEVIPPMQSQVSTDEQEAYSPSSSYGSVKTVKDNHIFGLDSIQNESLNQSSTITSICTFEVNPPTQYNESPNEQETCSNVTSICSYEVFPLSKPKESIEEHEAYSPLSNYGIKTIKNNLRISDLSENSLNIANTTSETHSSFNCSNETTLSSNRKDDVTNAVPSNDKLPLSSPEECIECPLLEAEGSNKENITHGNITVGYEECNIKENNNRTNISDEEDDLSQLRLIALSTKGKTTLNSNESKENNNLKESISQPNTLADEDYDNEEEDVLQLRVAALKSAVMKKHEERKKRGLHIKKRKRASSSFVDEIFLLPCTPDKSCDQDLSFENISSQPENMPPSPVISTEESVQGVEDMEIADSDSGGDIIQDDDNDKPQVNDQPIECWESLNSDPKSILPPLPNCKRISDKISNVYSTNSSLVIPPQPMPPGVDTDFLSSTFSNKSQNYTQSSQFPSVLPPPPPPPALIFSHLPPPPPPPPPLSSINTQFQTHLNFSASYSLSEPELLLPDSAPDTSYNSEPLTVNPIYTSSTNANLELSTATIKTTGEIRKDDYHLSGYVSHLNKGTIHHPNLTSKNKQLRQNLRKIPVIKNVQKKTLTKKRLKKVRKQIRKSCNKITQPEPKVLCITNTSSLVKSKAKVNLLALKNHKFSSMCTVDGQEEPSRRTIYKQDSSTPMCTTDALVIDNWMDADNYGEILSSQNSYNIKTNQNTYDVKLTEPSSTQDKTPIQEDEMDLSEMIVLDEVGMSPEHKPRYDQYWDYNSPKEEEEDEDTLRDIALTSLSTKTTQAKQLSDYSHSSRMHIRPKTSSTHYHKNKENFKTARQEFNLGGRGGSRSKIKDFENISVTRRVDVNDPSKYRLTRVVVNEPRRSVVHGKESLKVVIPSESPLQILSPQPSPPVVERFVINVGQDSDSEEDCEWMRSVRIQETAEPTPLGPVVDHDLERSIDQLLMNARQNVDSPLANKPAQYKTVQPKQSTVNLTPKSELKQGQDTDISDTPLRLLPKETQKEYQRLKKIIEEKEKQRQQQLKKTINRQVRKSQSPLQYVLINETNKLNQEVDKNCEQGFKASQDSIPSCKNADRLTQNDSARFVCQEGPQKDRTSYKCLDTDARSEISRKETALNNCMENCKSNLSEKNNEELDIACKSTKNEKTSCSQEVFDRTQISETEKISSFKTNVGHYLKEFIGKCAIEKGGEVTSVSLIEGSGVASKLTNKPKLQGSQLFETSRVSHHASENVNSVIGSDAEVESFNISTVVDNASIGSESNTLQVDTTSQNSILTKYLENPTSSDVITDLKGDVNAMVISSDDSGSELKKGTENNLESSRNSQKTCNITTEHENYVKSSDLHAGDKFAQEDGCLKAVTCQTLRSNEDDSPTCVEMLTANQSELLCERFALVDQLSEMSESLSELEREQARVDSVVEEICRLRKTLQEAEAKLHSQHAATVRMEQALDTTHQAICSRVSHLQLIESTCCRLGNQLHGPNYRIPASGKELMEKKIQQVNDKKRKIIARREVVRNLMENPNITSNELTDLHVLKKRQSCEIVQQDLSDPIKSSLLLLPDISLTVQLPAAKTTSTIASPQQVVGSSVQQPGSISKRSSQSCSSDASEQSQRSDYHLSACANLSSTLEMSNSSPSSNIPDLGIEKSSCSKLPLLELATRLEEAEPILLPSPISATPSTCQMMPDDRSTFELTSKPQNLHISSPTVQEISQTFDKLSKQLFDQKKEKVTKRPFSDVSDVLSESDNTKRPNISVNNISFIEEKLNPGENDREQVSRSCDRILGDIVSNSSVPINPSVSKPTKSALQYKSVLPYKNSTRKAKWLLPSSSGENILCPYDLSGRCQDKQCRFRHFESRS